MSARVRLAWRGILALFTVLVSACGAGRQRGTTLCGQETMPAQVIKDARATEPLIGPFRTIDDVCDSLRFCEPATWRCELRANNYPDSASVTAGVLTGSCPDIAEAMEEPAPGLKDVFPAPTTPHWISGRFDPHIADYAVVRTSRGWFVSQALHRIHEDAKLAAVDGNRFHSLASLNRADGVALVLTYDAFALASVHSTRNDSLLDAPPTFRKVVVLIGVGCSDRPSMGVWWAAHNFENGDPSVPSWRSLLCDEAYRNEAMSSPWESACKQARPWGTPEAKLPFTAP